MTMLTLNSIGLCANFSPVGDRAFRYAFALARRYHLQLNVFNFLSSPWQPCSVEDPPANLPEQERDRRLVQADQALRLYYEDRLGDYLDVGFRVCEGCETVELRRCLLRGEYELLVVPYPEPGGRFGKVTIEQFANHFLSPVVLVGRGRKVRYYLNAQAEFLADKLNLFRGSWRRVPQVRSSCGIG